MLLHSYGLLHVSFQPENFARRIRNLTRHREKHLDEASRAIQHMQKALEQMNIKITNVLSDITGLSGMRMINAICLQPTWPLPNGRQESRQLTI